MSVVLTPIERCYRDAKNGNWSGVIASWRRAPNIASQCSRYRKPTSLWTFLHQAAYFGHETACRELIQLGAAVTLLSREKQTAADVAEERKHAALAELLRKACHSADSLWSPSKDPSLLPSSSSWDEATERQASEAMRVAYGGGIVDIPQGSRYFVDSFERTLVGWHGTYAPPCGMDGESMI
jgi:hypothetical protein